MGPRPTPPTTASVVERGKLWSSKILGQSIVSIVSKILASDGRLGGRQPTTSGIKRKRGREDGRGPSDKDVRISIIIGSACDLPPLIPNTSTC